VLIRVWLGCAGRNRVEGAGGGGRGIGGKKRWGMWKKNVSTQVHETRVRLTARPG